MLIARLSVLSIHRAGEGQYAHKGAVAPLSVIIMAVSFRRLLLLPTDHQARIQDLDCVVIQLQLGDVCRYDKRVIGLSNIASRCFSEGH
jgi:hypothetical protein